MTAPNSARREHAPGPSLHAVRELPTAARSRALRAQADAAWERASKASVRTFELLHQLSDELASIPAASHLLPVLAELEDSIADEGGAVSEAARLLDAAAAGRGQA